MSEKNVMQKVVLGAVIIKDNRALIVQRNSNEDVFPGLWELPSGKKEDLENADEALVREVKEETGLDIVPTMPFSVFCYQIDKGDYVKDSTQINYLVKLSNLEQAVKLSPEHQSSVWIKQSEIGDYEISESTKKVLKRAFEVHSRIK